MLAPAVMVSAVSLMGCPAPDRAGAKTPIKQTRIFLDAYARGDAGTVMAMLDPGGAAIYGSDLAETYDKPAQIRAMLADDQRLWRGGARIGDVTHLSMRCSRRFVSEMFDAPFTVGGRTVDVRFAMVWRRAGGAWFLSQSSNVVPTAGSSARELLSR
ncbi:MAG: DUF4440 domain-containing protein [Proteobacteria bacterium]|nr:DUF4440 domain-containing protein [Pseudomonadota bacterium]